MPALPLSAMTFLLFYGSTASFPGTERSHFKYMTLEVI
jgi:hypothetical protein